MPYLKKARKVELDDLGDANKPGELNYLITQLFITYLDNNGLNYQSINDIVGAAKCASDEFYTRVARPFEDEKIRLNGDVYPLRHGEKKIISQMSD